eukprot:16431665-Heterocapsa_arctica.AAC.1
MQANDHACAAALADIDDGEKRNGEGDARTPAVSGEPLCWAETARIDVRQPECPRICAGKEAGASLPAWDAAARAPVEQRGKACLGEAEWLPPEGSLGKGLGGPSSVKMEELRNSAPDAGRPTRLSRV